MNHSYIELLQSETEMLAACSRHMRDAASEPGMGREACYAVSTEYQERAAICAKHAREAYERSQVVCAEEDSW
jgi:hypothetical protein